MTPEEWRAYCLGLEHGMGLQDLRIAVRFLIDAHFKGDEDGFMECAEDVLAMLDVVLEEDE